MKPVLKKILGETIENKFGREDPYFESVPATRIVGKKEKIKKVRKALPPGLSDHDAMVLTKVKRRAYRLDSSLFELCGIKFGWGSVIGLVPIAGDVVDAMLAMMVVRTAKTVEGGLPAGVLMTMYFWVIVDFIVGLVPFAGDIFDAMVRANTNNAIALENHLREKGKKNLKKSGLPVPDVDPSDPDTFDRMQDERERSDHISSSQPRRNERMTTNRDDRHHRRQSSGVAPAKPTRPSEARVRDDRRSGGGSFFGWGSRRERVADPEMGRTDDRPSRKPSRRG
ncbi:PH domain-containing protein [Apiospora marii]|uniref:PH domain-containing protein n=2 Tax=Apiospora marii TaxID=335849 RepID=A0ABR1RLH1_9PEZI